MIIKIFFMVSILTCLVGNSNASTTITAQVVRNQVGSGETFASSGFPFPPGLVTEQTITDGAIKIMVSGSEVAANVSALRGRHSDGTIRSALIQFNVNSMAQNDTLSAQVIIGGGTRTNADPAYVRPTLAVVQNNNVIIPTDPAYITSTLITFQRLLPIGQGTTAEEAQYTALAENQFDYMSNTYTFPQIDGTASYEGGRAMLTMWARTGDKKYFNQAIKWVLYKLPYTTPAEGCAAQPYINPDLRTSDNGVCGLMAEWEFARLYSYSSVYLLTGYRDLWSTVAHMAQYTQRFITNQGTSDINTVLSTEYDQPRYNYSNSYGALIAASMIDATKVMDGFWFSGQQLNFANRLSWMLNSIKSHEWDLQWIPFSDGGGTIPADGTTIGQGATTAKLLGVYTNRYDPKATPAASMPSSGYIQINTLSGGNFSAGALSGITATATGSNESDYRQGLVGLRSNSPRGMNYNSNTESVVPSFQLIFPSNFLIDYYLNVNADSRIPGMVKKNVDVLLKQVRVMRTGDYSYQQDGGAWGNPIYCKPYRLLNPVDTRTTAEGSDAAPGELPEYARLIAFVLKTSGNATVNGADYNTWYSRIINTANNSPVQVLIWQWKLFGQFYGFGADAPWIMAQGSLTGASSYREPTYYADIPRDVPDLQRGAETPPQPKIFIIRGSSN